MFCDLLPLVFYLKTYKTFDLKNDTGVSSSTCLGINSYAIFADGFACLSRAMYLCASVCAFLLSHVRCVIGVQCVLSCGAGVACIGVLVCV